MNILNTISGRFRFAIIPVMAVFIFCSCEQADAQKTTSKIANQSQTRTETTKAAFSPRFVSATEANALLHAEKNMTVLDIRTPFEIRNGHIFGAVFADYYAKNFREQLSKLDRQTPYLVHCRSGGRSTKALQTLEKLGFTNVTHLDGGMNAWKKAKLPTVKP